MKVVEIASGPRWRVLAICEPTGCPVLDFIASLERKRGDQVLSDLQQFVPNYEPRDWVRADFSDALTKSDGILEFRWPTSGGGTPRILWFYDEGRVVVCSHGLNRKGTMKRAQIEQAESAKKLYLAAKSAGTLEVVSIEALDEELGGGDCDA